MSASDSIDRSSFEPPYVQLANLLRQQIAAGGHVPGDRLPSESELCEKFHVSRMTARKAIEQLVREGIAITEHGRGTFVRHPDLGSATFDLQDLRNLLADPNVEVRILLASVVTPSARARSRLNLRENEEAISIKRVLRVGGENVLFHSEYLVFDPRRPLIEAELGVSALKDLFSRTGGSALRFGRLTLHAAVLSDSEAEFLGEEPGTPAWVIEHLFCDDKGLPQSWGRFIGRADRLTFTTTIGIPVGKEG